MSGSSRVHQLFADAVAPRTEPAIERLRHEVRSAQREDAVMQAEPITEIVKGIHQRLPVPKIAEIAGVTCYDVVTVVQKFGVWLARVNGPAPITVHLSAEVLDGDQRMQLNQLFTATPAPLGKVSIAERDAAVAKLNRNRRRRGLLPRDIVLPDGFAQPWEDPATGEEVTRDVRKAYGAIVAAFGGSTDQATIIRFLARSAQAPQVLQAEHLSIVWTLARMGRLDEIDKVNPSYWSLNQQFVAAYDILEGARADAMRALARLLSDRDALDPSEAPNLVAHLRPLFEADARRIGEIADMDPSPQRDRFLARELNWLVKRIESNPSMWLLDNIGKLHDGQMRRVCELHGLNVAGHSRTDESAIRDRLGDLGLRPDEDTLVPMALRARNAGFEDMFWEAMSRRAKNDPAWDAELAAHLDADA